jgi:hypothetical protein
MVDTQVVQEREASGLKRAVTPAMLLLFVVGDMVGGGIYALVGEVGGRVGGALWTGFALALLLALFTAGSYAELVTKYPKAGGAALYAHRAFGRPFVTFLLGFAVMMSSITSAAALSRAFGGDYLSEFVDLPVILTGLVIVGADRGDQLPRHRRVDQGQRRLHHHRAARPAARGRDRRRVRLGRRRRPGPRVRVQGGLGLDPVS